MTTDIAALRVLVIDDHAVIRRTLRMILGGMKITDVEEAGSVEAAEEILRGAPAFDVIFCDLNLPGRDGIELLRKFPTLAERTAVVLLSAEDERILHSVAAMGRAVGLHVLAAIPKPPTAQKLRDALAHLDDVVPSRRPAPAALALAEADIDLLLDQKLLRMHYQPKVEASSGALVGVEALLRARHPVHGDLPPRSIVDAARQFGRVEPLTLHVLQESIAAASRLRAEGLEIAMSVNLDATALRQAAFPDLIQRIAAGYDVPLGKMVLELTEEQLFDDFVSAMEITTRLRLKRCQLSIDAFGTGVSGLRQLQDLPFTELKVARTFVTGCDGTNVGGRTIIAAAVALSRVFGLRCVAMGVETQGEWDTVKSLGVDAIQGFIVSRALPEASLLDWIGEWAMRPG